MYLFKLIISMIIFMFTLSYLATATSSPSSSSVPVTGIHILAGNYFFQPKHIIVEVNQPIRLSIEKAPGIVPHNFILHAPAANLSIEISLDTEPKTVSFTPTQTGRFTFYCDKQILFFKSHRERGMEGILEVIAPN